MRAENIKTGRKDSNLSKLELRTLKLTELNVESLKTDRNENLIIKTK